MVLSWDQGIHYPTYTLPRPRLHLLLAVTERNSSCSSESEKNKLTLSSTKTLKHSLCVFENDENVENGKSINQEDIVEPKQNEGVAEVECADDESSIGTFVPEDDWVGDGVPVFNEDDLQVLFDIEGVLELLNEEAAPLPPPPPPIAAPLLVPPRVIQPVIISLLDTPPADNDIAGGRQAAGSTRPANVEYRRTVAFYKPHYRSLGRRFGDKTKIRNMIVDDLNLRGFRFLGRTPDGRDVVLTLEGARKRVGQSLRENSTTNE